MSDDLRELIEKLRCHKHVTQGDGLSALRDTCDQAADALEAMTKEREIKEDALRVLDIAAHHGGFVYPKHRMRAEEVLERARSEQKGTNDES